ncbi:MAG: Cys-tRNA(Pro) deacylase [Clostridia bacterium]|nr:Cys-tRNA(Pro) deacylase [Clostridia bacterium]
MAVVTNAVRLLRAAGVPFETREYEVDESDLSGVHIAQSLGIDKDTMFKTLVAHAEKNYYVFCIPSGEELDLKKCASLTGEKKIEMLPMKELLSVTGYIRGGCSPVGMKKKFPTYIDESALLFDGIYVSAGMRGLQLKIAPADLISFAAITVADLTK